MEKDYTYVAIQTGGLFNEACVREGYMKADDCAVIEMSQFMRFINDGEVSRPLFVSTQYSVCLETAEQLNDSARRVLLLKSLGIK